MSLTLYIKHSCPSILGTIRTEPKRMGEHFAPACLEHNLNAIEDIKSKTSDFVVITGSYGGYLEKLNYDHEPILPPTGASAGALNNRQVVLRRLAETVTAIGASGADPIIVLPHPIMD